MMRLVGLLGGTFNPVHFGHLRMAQELAQALDLDEVRFIPAANPPHKSKPTVSAEHRAAMVQLAIADDPLFKLDTRELSRKGSSYTIDTLISLRQEFGQNIALCLMMGSDAFLGLNTWHRWQSLLDYCHIVIVQRPHAPLLAAKLAPDLTLFLHEFLTENKTDLASKSAGCIYMQTITPQDISATQIRALLKAGKSPQQLTPANVIKYIAAHRLYA